MQKKSLDITFGDKVVNLSTGKLAPQANAAVVATYGKTVVLATVMLGKVDASKDYFPLSVEFTDKLYAGGQIKGGKWIKREGGPSDTAILFGRIIDRSIRPLFPEGFHNEVQVIATVLSNDKENDVIIPAFLAASAALSISNIPFNAPVSAVRVGLVNEKLVVNPSLKDLETSQMDLLVCTGKAGINMIEADANIVNNETVLKAIDLAKETGDNVNTQLEAFAKDIAQTKVEFEPYYPSEDLLKNLDKQLKPEIDKFLSEGVDGAHMAGQQVIIEKAKEMFKAQLESSEVAENILLLAVDELLKKYFRAQTISGKRYDKRAIDEIRALNVEAGVLPCTHGSALFERGLTQALTVTTLGPLTEMQNLQDSLGESTKRYIHYYSAMPFSTGQTGRTGRPGRREIGHGALAEKALVPVVPSADEFPYTIVLTSEVLSQNGSSSMASTCGSTMSMLDAGIPLKDKVAGISIGLVAETDDKYLLLTDIAGIEDHFGDMDFKITGTRTGVTAIQLDIKRQGLTLPMVHDTFVASTKARLQILDKMDSVLATHRPELSPYAPKITQVTVPVEKIGEVIGSGGKTIKGLMEKYGVQIDMEDNGRASISSLDAQKNADCAFEIEAMVREVQVGEEFDGVVTRVENFGAFVEFLPGREALLHVSEMSGGFLSDPNSIIKIGDKIHVRVSGFNDNYQIKLAAPEFKAAHPGQPRQEGDFGGGRPPFRPQGGGDRNRTFANFGRSDRPQRPRR